jgi:hypothetical protein
MKFFKALIFAVIFWYPIGYALAYVMKHKMHMVNGDGFATIGTSIISVFIFFYFYDYRNFSLTSTIGAVKDMKESIEFDLEEKSADFYAQAEEEFDEGVIDKGLWSQAFVKSKGNENLRKLEYMKLRVKQLKKNA